MTMPEGSDQRLRTLWKLLEARIDDGYQRLEDETRHRLNEAVLRLAANDPEPPGTPEDRSRGYRQQGRGRPS